MLTTDIGMRRFGLGEGGTGCGGARSVSSTGGARGDGGCVPHLLRNSLLVT